MSDPHYRVELSPRAERALRALPPMAAVRIRGAILALGRDPRPRGVDKARGSGYWRLRVGDMRVVYAVDDQARLVVVTKVARRSESTYRRPR